jgi:hypothetical protein
MNRHDKNKTIDQPLAFAHFGTFAFLPTRKPNAQNAKEPKFSSRTTTQNAIPTVSVLTYNFTTKNKKNKSGGFAPAFNIIGYNHYTTN